MERIELDKPALELPTLESTVKGVFSLCVSRESCINQWPRRSSLSFSVFFSSRMMAGFEV
jgi:hypothetical protein